MTEINSELSKAIGRKCVTAEGTAVFIRGTRYVFLQTPGNLPWRRQELHIFAIWCLMNGRAFAAILRIIPCPPLYATRNEKPRVPRLRR